LGREGPGQAPGVPQTYKGCFLWRRQNQANPLADPEACPGGIPR